MKIDEVLARHPWPWREICPAGYSQLRDANGEYVSEAYPAILELVEAYVASKAKEPNHGS